jgi:transmembrane sensor
LEVLVTEGRVAVEETARGRSLLPVPLNEGLPVLVAGQRVTVEPAVVADASRSVRVAAVEPVEMKERLAWRIPRLEFDGAELAQAVEQLNRVNRLQISLEGAGIGHLRISGTFFADDPRTFARLAATSLGLGLEDRGEAEILLRQISAARKP